MVGFTCKERIYNTIATIEYSDEFEDNWELFNRGIEILASHDCGSEFDDEDRDVLEEIFTIINC